VDEGFYGFLPVTGQSRPTMFSISGNLHQANPSFCYFIYKRMIYGYTS
jgi:hypothetical protein